jgi:hypothetical protein
MSAKKKITEKPMRTTVPDSADSGDWEKSADNTTSGDLFSHTDAIMGEILDRTAFLIEEPASLKPSPELSRRWKDFLSWFEGIEISDLSSMFTEASMAEKLVKKGWAVWDTLRCDFDFHLEEPTSSLHPIPVILSNRDGNWSAPRNLIGALKKHPVIRSLAGDREKNHRDSLLDLLNWAKDSEDSELLERYRLIWDALNLERLIFESNWGEEILESEKFWEMLIAASHFGFHYSRWITYKDGSLLKSNRKSLAMRKHPDRWRVFIEKELREIAIETGCIIRPAKLRKRLGATLPAANGDFLKFQDERCNDLPEITWPQFQIRAKKAGENLDLQGKSPDF